MRNQLKKKYTTVEWLLLLSIAALVSMPARAGSDPHAGAAAVEKVPTEPRFTALVFSGTAGDRHMSIPHGVEAIRRLGEAHDFAVDATEDPAVFTSDTLGAYDVVVFLNSSGDVLDESQQAGFEAYLRAGGGFAGVHGAAGTEYDWAWYGDLVGAYLEDHAEPQQAVVEVLDRVHPSTRHLTPIWERFDEWYNFRTNPRGDVHVLAVLEESSYEGGTMGHDHPISWAHLFEGSRSWYTALGHTAESYTEPAFVRHLLGGIEWAAGVVEGDAAATAASSFEKVVLMDQVTDPMEIAIDQRGRVFVAERSGPIKMWDPATNRSVMVGFVPVRMTIEDGLLGLTLDPDFDQNGWLYIYYAPANGGPQRLSRLTFDGKRIDMGSEKVLLEIETQQQECCHSAGSLTFGPDGNLFLSTGDNTNPYPLGGSPIDERPGFRVGDAQRTSANTNDLRGKILRIRPLPDGTYDIPDGNLFEGDSLHRPEIYTMGHRNPYRISVDPKTGWLYWGDVGIGNAPSADRGPWGWEEFNQAREPGFYGWPYFVGPNDAYRDFDYVEQEAGPFFDPQHPVNESVNNTGAVRLPRAQPAMIWYTYGQSEEFPEMGTGGMSAMGGPVYRYEPENAAPHALPAYYDGSFFIYEWMRHWVKEVKFDEDGQPLEISEFAPGLEFVRPTDIEIGPDGRLYVAEWGQTFWGSNEDAQIVRVDYVGSEPRAIPTSRRAETNTSMPTGLEVAGGPSSDAAIASGDTVRFMWPPQGAIFEYGEPIPYETNAAESGVEPVIVRPYSGHDTHAHALPAVEGARGTVVISREFIHVPDLHYVNRFGVIEARTGDGDGLGHRVVLRPRILEAEYVSGQHLAERQTFGKHPAEPDFAQGALTVMKIESGGHLAFEPLNLVGIDTLILRVKPMPGADLEVRADALDGPVLAGLRVDSTSGTPARGASMSGQPDGVVYNEALAGLPESVLSAYRGWRDVRVPISGSATSDRIFLTVRNDELEGVVLYVDRLEFVGPGAGAFRK